MSEVTYDQDKIDKLLLANLKLSKSLEAVIAEIISGGDVSQEDLEKIASVSKLGLIKVDGQSILIDEDGTIKVNPDKLTSNVSFSFSNPEPIER